METVEIVQFASERHQHLLPAIVDLHISCVESDGALLRFLPPFTSEKRQKVQSFWEERIAQVATGHRISFMALLISEGRSKEKELGGLVELGMPEADTGPFRGDVEMLMVSPHHRRKGLAKKLINVLEAVAQANGKTLLQLSSEVDSAAEKYLYPRLGYVKIGTVPNFGISPTDGSLKDLAYFYKDLGSLADGDNNGRHPQKAGAERVN